MDITKIPFEVELVNYGFVRRYRYIETETHVLTMAGNQYKSLAGVECVKLLKTSIQCDDLRFRSPVSVAVLCILKAGI